MLKAIAGAPLVATHRRLCALAPSELLFSLRPPWSMMFGTLKNDPPTKILFVCAQNKIRSVTAEKMFAGSQRYQVRSRGVANDARIKLTAGDLGWADLIFVMEKNHKNRIANRFPEEIEGKRIVCLFIEDIYEPMEASLLQELRRKLAPYLLLPEE